MPRRNERKCVLVIIVFFFRFIRYSTNENDFVRRKTKFINIERFDYGHSFQIHSSMKVKHMNLFPQISTHVPIK